jgi:GT2 family glycosyltransferase
MSIEAHSSAETRGKVSIVVLTFNRRDEVLRTLAKLVALPERPPIVVVDNGSCDGTVDAIKAKTPQVEIVALRKNQGASARNFGVAALHTPYVAFCDDDTWWEPGSIARGVRMLEQHPSVAVVCARIVVGEDMREDPTCALMADSPLQACGATARALLGFMAGASVVRVAAYRQVGGYCANLFLGGEEELMALDLAARGWQMVYDSSLLVRHLPSSARDAGSRRALLVRNAIWVACLRLPWSAVLRRMLALLALRDAPLRTLWQTLVGLPWAMRHRRVIPQHVERMRQCIEGHADRPAPGPGAPRGAGSTGLG